MKILYLTNIPSPYIVNYFNELGKLCDLTVVFEKKSSSERNGRWDNFKFDNFNGKILKGVSTGVDSAFSIGVLKYLLIKKYDHIIITNPSTPTGILSILFLKLFNKPYLLESEGGFAKNGKGIKERIKKFIMKNAKYYFSTNIVGDEYFLKYGAKKEKLIKYPFTSIFENDILPQPLSLDEKLILRLKNGIIGKKVVVSVGRFIKSKNFDWLIEQWKKMDNETYLYVIGEGEEQKNYEYIITRYNLSNVKILGFREKFELFEILKCADLLVHPTKSDVWGLVVNEAMANGIPVITTPMCIAGIEMIKNNYNGFVLELNNEYIDVIQRLINNEEQLNRLSENALKTAKYYTFENMAKIHIYELQKISSNDHIYKV